MLFGGVFRVLVRDFGRICGEGSIEGILDWKDECI